MSAYVRVEYLDGTRRVATTSGGETATMPAKSRDDAREEWAKVRADVDEFLGVDEPTVAADPDAAAGPEFQDVNIEAMAQMKARFSSVDNRAWGELEPFRRREFRIRAIDDLYAREMEERRVRLAEEEAVAAEAALRRLAECLYTARIESLGIHRAWCNVSPEHKAGWVKVAQAAIAELGNDK